MKNKAKKFCSLLMTIIMCLMLLSACSSKKDENQQEQPDANQTSLEEENQSSNVYDLPSMGLTAVLPDALVERMNTDDVSMLINEIGTEDNSALLYGYLSWNMMEGNNQDIQNYDLGNVMQCIGVLGVYQTDIIDSLSDLTGCDEHQELGQNADGTYKYYLSINTNANTELTDLLRQIKTTITEMSAFEQISDFDAPPSDFTGPSLGSFTTQDINGNTYTQDIFKDYDLTMVNVFTTWCSPCVSEMPDLEKLHQQMADKGVNVIGVVLDVLDEKGEIVQEDLERAQLLVQRTGVTYPILLPDTGYMNGRLTGIEAFPETFFVDKNGNVVGESYSGSGGLEDWIEVVEQELSNLKGGS